MKKILIVNNNMHIGGVQKALISLLWAIRDRYDVTLLLFYPGGPCMKEIPEGVKLLTPASGFRYLGMTRQDTRTAADKLGRLFYGAIARTFGRKHALRLMGLGQKKLTGFDVAISYLHNSDHKAFYGGCNEFVLNHVDAEQKIAFLHCDYSRCGADTAENARQYSRFDRIAACSQGCADAFVRANPALKDKVCVVANCHRFHKIRQAAEAAPVQLQAGTINLVTVARLGKEKGVERAVEAIAALGDKKETLHYYIIGDGIQRPLLEQRIAQYGLQETVTLCGMLENPYGYIHAADLLLIPSYNEAAPLVIGEAASLATPILSTKTSSAEEMIEAPGFGWVCENSEAGMTNALRDLLAEPDRLAAVRSRMAAHTPDNAQALAQLIAAIGDKHDFKDQTK